MNNPKQNNIFSNEERALLINEISQFLSQKGIPAEEYTKAINSLMSFSDEELAYVASAFINNDSGKTDKASSLFLKERDNERFWAYLGRYKPDSHFCLDDKSSNALIFLWYENEYEFSAFPSDIFFSGNFAIPNCEITVKHNADSPNPGSETNGRVILFNDYSERLAKQREYEKGTEPVCVGVVSLDIHAEGLPAFSIPIGVLKNCDYILFGGIGYKNITLEKIEMAMEIDSTLEQDIYDSASVLLFIWRGIQTAFLNPEFKSLFQNPEEEMTLCDNPDKSSRDKLKLHYMNKYIINDDDIKKITDGMQ